MSKEQVIPKLIPVFRPAILILKQIGRKFSIKNKKSEDKLADIFR